MPITPTNQDQNYDWISVYKTLSKKLLEYRKNQSELLKIVKTVRSVGLPTISLTDKVTEHTEVDLEEIDPFTFFANFNRGTTKENRKKILEIIINEMGLRISVPSTYKGIPIVNPQKSWFFPYKYERNEKDIDLLWELFYQAITTPNNISEEIFLHVMNIKQVGLKKITIGLFWVKPENFLPLDSNTVNFLEVSANLSLDKRNITLEKYLNLNDSVRKTFPEMSFVQISDYAYRMPEENIIAIFGNSEEFFPILDDFYEYLENLTNGSWFQNRQRIGVKELTYLRASKKPKCLDATILLLAYQAEIIAEFHVIPPARKFDPPIQDEDGKTSYSVGFRIKSDEYGPLIFLYDEPLHKSEVPIEKGFPKAYRGGAYVSFEALEYIRDKGKRVRHPSIKQNGKEIGRDNYNFVFPSKNDSDFAQEKLVSNFDKELIEKVRRALSRKRQTIFIGPPGTSKTYFAKLFALAYSKAYQLVQFHPSYEYSDFIEGFVPKSTQGVLNFELKEKIFLTACRLALTQKTSDDKIIIIIDEINRGNLGKIFGELISSLEDRDHPVILSSGKKITIPKNLLLIGTMNSADRSVGVIDKALRRRFQFVEFPPDKNILQKALQTIYLEDEEKISPEKVIEIFNRINHVLRKHGKDKNLLIGHTLFIHRTWQELNDELEMNIIPYIEESFYGDQRILQKIRDSVSEYSEFLPVIKEIGKNIE